jgi:hypothetical protein
VFHEGIDMSDGRDGIGGVPGRTGVPGAPGAVDLRGPAALAAAVGLTVGAIGSAVVVSNLPRITGWWRGRAVPTAVAVRKRVLREEDAAPTGSTILTRSTLRDFTRRVDTAVREVAEGLRGARTDHDLVGVLLAASIIADRVRTRPEDDTAVDAFLPELAAAMDRLTSAPVVDAVNRALTGGAARFPDGTLTIVRDVFGAGSTADGGFVPLRIERVADALRVTRIITLPQRPSEA